MISPSLHGFEIFLPRVLIRMTRSTTQRRPHFKSTTFLQSITKPNTFLAKIDGGFNSPDPSPYCQDLGVGNSVAVLENWIKNLDIDRHYPRLPEASNLAALVPQ